MMKIVLRTFLVVFCCTEGLSLRAATEEIGGITWTYTTSSGAATVTGMSDCTGTVFVPDRLGGCCVTALGSNSMCVKNFSRVILPETIVTIGDDAFINCGNMEYIEIPSSVRTIGKSAFQGCSKLRKVIIPEGVTTLRFNTFLDCSSLEVLVLPSTLRTLDNNGYYQGVFMNCGRAMVIVKCSPNIAGINESRLTEVQLFRCPRNLSGAWINKVGYGKFAGYSDSYLDCSVDVVSSSIRENDPTVMDVVYKVTSKKQTVKVRVLAFEDGVRSFSKVVRPETFVDGTGVNVGDNITPNVEHKISWRVSGDWKTKLAKVKFEVLASEGELLPLETMTIPASQQYGKMKITWNAISESQVFAALLWQYADKDPGLTLSNGVLKNGSTELARNGGLSYGTYTWDSGYFDDRVNAARYVLQKMGYSLLTGAPLTYANQETRLGLSPSGARQYGYKIVE